MKEVTICNDKNATSFLPETIRVSVGSSIILGLLEGRLDAAPSTAYLMTHKIGRCTANCSFCAQARQSKSKASALSRVTWPAFSTKLVLDKLDCSIHEGRIGRVCIQALNYLEVLSHLIALVNAIHQRTNAPISVSYQPDSSESIASIARAGAQRISIALDAATEDIFEKVKGSSVGGPYCWQKQFELLENAVSLFGKGMVSTHLIVGLGETEEEIVATIQKCVDKGVLPALFAFTPIPGTVLENQEQPPVQRYRLIQIARHLIFHGLARIDHMKFNRDGDLVNFGMDEGNIVEIIDSGEAFRTSGCPECNRPFYNEKPSGPIYNFPRKLTAEELRRVKTQLPTDVF